MDELYTIARRSNIECFYYQAINGKMKTIFLYEDHRTLLNVLFEASKLINDHRVPNLIFFDRHDDACPTMHLSELLHKMGKTSFEDVTSKEFWPFVEFDLSYLDDDWLLAGMELGLINNAVVIGQELNANISRLQNKYQTEDKLQHKLYSIPHLNSSLNNRGCLGDTCITDTSYTDIRNIFQFNNNRFDSADIYPFILDFDLDCFTSECRETTIAWAEKIFKEEYSDNFKTADFMQQLISRCQFITICKESKCCGGLGESNKILSYLDRYIFDGSLGTEAIY
ncbi:MAG: hypothetical protein J6B07_02500 [Opitutales bacterium]|nr:hypothetical protein [Opitutales bacterium]